MERLLMTGVAILSMFVVSSTPSAGQNSNARHEMRDRFVGAWRLAWLEEPGPDGNIHKADCTGLLVFTADGHMSVQVMYRGAQNTSGPYAQGGYEASFGTYKVEDDHTFTFHVEGALARTLTGKDFKRLFELSGDQLIVTSADPNEHWRVAWKRDPDKPLR